MIYRPCMISSGDFFKHGRIYSNDNFLMLEETGRKAPIERHNPPCKLMTWAFLNPQFFNFVPKFSKNPEIGEIRPNEKEGLLEKPSHPAKHAT